MIEAIARKPASYGKHAGLAAWSKCRLSHLEIQVRPLVMATCESHWGESAGLVRLCMIDGLIQANICTFGWAHPRQIIHGVSKS